MKSKLSLNDWINEADEQNISLAKYLLKLNAKEDEITEEETTKKLLDLLNVMEKSIERGLTGVKSASGLTGGAAKLLARKRENKKIRVLGDFGYDAVVFALAVAESNAAMGKIVAAPTAGASGVLPGVLFSLKKNFNFSYEELASALNIAGSIGVVIANRATLSGAKGGCQAECGSSAAMAAGAATFLLGGSNQEIGNSVAMAIKNILGLVCDPVAGLVEVPCVKRNAGAVSQALLATQMALAGIESFIPADETIDALKDVGDRMPSSLKETSCGGLAISPTALEWAKKYFSKE
jgi:L-serine dehydratase